MFENKSFTKFILAIIIFFLILTIASKSFTGIIIAFKIFLGLMLFLLLDVVILIIIMVRDVKRYYDDQQQASEGFDKFFNEFQKAEYDFERYQRFKRAQEEYRQQKEQNNYSDYTYSNTPIQKDIKEAMILFGYKDLKEINEKSLKQKYRVLIKKAHPDNGGSLEKTKIINIHYNTLLKFLDNDNFIN